MDIFCNVGKEVFPAILQIRSCRKCEGDGTHDVGMENNLLHHVCVVRKKEVNTVLKIVVKI
jgi:hypothetical protein